LFDAIYAKKKEPPMAIAKFVYHQISMAYGPPGHMCHWQWKIRKCAKLQWYENYLLQF
jgi:hypothetical protein